MSTIHKARDEFVREARKILTHTLSLAVQGKPTLDETKINSKDHTMIVNRILNMIERLEDREKIAIESTAKIVDSLAAGKISVAQAKDLMKILHTKQLVEEKESMLEENTKAINTLLQGLKNG